MDTMKRHIHWPLVGVVVAMTLASTRAAVPGMVNGGTPSGVPISYDCAVRKAAWEFGKTTLPSRGDFRTLFDALQLQWCNETPPSAEDVWRPPKYPTPTSGNILYVQSGTSAGGDGSKDKPFATIAAAVAAAKSDTTILVREGVYYEQQIVIGAQHSGLTIQNFEGEHVTVSGGVPLTLSSPWQPYKVNNGSSGKDWVTYANQNNVYGRAHSGTDTATVKFIGKYASWDACFAAAKVSPKGPFQSVTYHEANFSRNAGWATQCFGTTDSFWSPRAEENIISARDESFNTYANIWELDLSHLEDVTEIDGLRINGQRAIRAKYPNGNPELTGPDAVDVLTYNAGWIDADTTWIKPADKWAETKDVVTNGSHWPGVNWPTAEEGGGGQEGEGDWGDFHIGQGGFCDDIFPPAGYWCSQNPPRGNCYDPKARTSRGCTQTHMSPDGVMYGDLLPHAINYSNPKGAVIQAWRGKARWFTNLCLVDSHDKESQTLLFDDKIGCNQGGEGGVTFSQWWIENVFEELDAPGEWFFNASEHKLYYFFNGTAPPTGKEEFVATHTKVLFNVSGSQAAPVKNVAIKGLEIRDTRLTYLGTDVADIHGMPTGGDWALQRSGAILFEGTERSTVDGCYMHHVDGNGIFLSNYNLNATVSNNEMSWIGDSAIAAWGSTGTCLDAACSQQVAWGVGPDARNRNQPLGTHVVGNLVRELGIWQKQSSFWFQAATAFSHIERNVHFNGPRAGVNFNDQMQGGDVIEGNLLTNCVRESGDHGPWNSWDRIPYIVSDGLIRDTTLPRVGDGTPGHVRSNGKPTVVPLFREIRKNFIIGTYNSQEDIDTDDGSSYYQTHDNYFAMADHGLKSDFGGQWNHHFRNVYAYVGQCLGSGHNLAFYNNTCVTGGGGAPCPSDATMTVSGNSVYTTDAKAQSCNGTVTAAFPSDAEINALGARAMAPFPMAAPGQEIFQP
eukprot:m.131773 g.131773  ORF g.131773 m.131773 type:complete len:956 (+) comp17481_c0_seq4:331-3198(+)